MLDVKDLEQSKNIAELLDEALLERIGSDVLHGYQIDYDSRADWNDTIHSAMEIAKQTVDVKNTPWEGASNVKYPLITKSAIDFAARTFPEIIQNDRVVRIEIIGVDLQGEKQRKASRVAQFMSFQLLNEDSSWEEGMDKLLHILPILGTVFKKTYYDVLKKKPISELCHPEKIIVNYNVSSLEDARRITHILTVYKNDIIERIRAGLFLNIDLDELTGNDDNEDNFVGDDDAPIALLEQHCYLDLDEDGYKEPYIVVVHKASGKVLRIVNRFKTIERTKDGKIKLIVPQHYFTDYHFLKSPDGGFYSLGLGSLLLPLNSAINTLINQTVDSGTLHNNQSGFVGRGLRLKTGEFKLKLGEWKVLDSASGASLSQNIFPMPTREPSIVLFQMMELLIQAGKDLSSMTDTLQGNAPMQNVAASSILAMVEQGLKVFTSVQKRLFRSLKKEYQKIYELNKMYLSQSHYQTILDDPAADKNQDFEINSMDILPVADPNMSSATQRLAKAQAILSLPGLNPYEAQKYYLEAIQLDQAMIDKLLPKPDPNAPPPPEVIKTLAEAEKLQAETRVVLADAQVNSEKHVIEVQKVQIQGLDAQTRAQESQARVQKMQGDAQVNQSKANLAMAKADHSGRLKEVELAQKSDIEAAKLLLKNKEIDKSTKEDNLND